MDEHTNPTGATGVPSAPPPYVGPPPVTAPAPYAGGTSQAVGASPAGFAAPLAAPAGAPMPPSDPFAAPPGPPTGYPVTWPAPTPEAPRKRKVWPWVLGIGGGLALLVGGGVLALVLVFSNNVADHRNPDYHGDPIAADDEASADGREVVVTGSGSVAFEIEDGWEDISGELDSMMPVFPDDELLELEDSRAWFAMDSYSGESGTMTMVLVLEGELLSVDQLTRFHAGVMDGLQQSSDLADTPVQIGATEEYVTGQGLAGFMSPVSMTMQGTQMDIDIYSVSRGDRVISVMVYKFGETTADTHVVIDSLRIDT